MKECCQVSPEVTQVLMCGTNTTGDAGNCQLKTVCFFNEEHVSITELNIFLPGMMSCEPTAGVPWGHSTGPAALLRPVDTS